MGLRSDRSALSCLHIQLHADQFCTNFGHRKYTVPVIAMDTP